MNYKWYPVYKISKMHYFQYRQLYLMMNAILTRQRRARIAQVKQEARRVQQERLHQHVVEIKMFGIRG